MGIQIIVPFDRLMGDNGKCDLWLGCVNLNLEIMVF